MNKIGLTLIQGFINWIRNLPEDCNEEMARKCAKYMERIITNIFEKEGLYPKELKEVYLKNLEEVLYCFKKSAFSIALVAGSPNDLKNNWDLFKSRLLSLGRIMLEELESSKIR